MKIDNEAIEKRLNKEATLKTIEGVGEVTIKPYLSIADEVAYTNVILENSYEYDFLEDREAYNPIYSNVAKAIAYLQFFTDIELPTKSVDVGESEQSEIIDSEKAYEIYNVFGLDALLDSGYVFDLNKRVDEAIKFKNDSIIANIKANSTNNETLKKIGVTFDKVSAIGDKVLGILENLNSTIGKDGGKILNKLKKAIDSNKVNELLNKMSISLPEDVGDLVGIAKKNKFNGVGENADNKDVADKGGKIDNIVKLNPKSKKE